MFNKECQTCINGEVCNEPRCNKNHCEGCEEFREVALN